MKILKYFFECCFHEGSYYEDLDEIIKNFKDFENKKTKEELTSELNNIIKTNNYEKALRLIDKYSGRIMSFKKIKIFIKFLYDKMCNIPTTIVPKDFYDIKTLIKNAAPKKN